MDSFTSVNITLMRTFMFVLIKDRGQQLGKRVCKYIWVVDTLIGTPVLLCNTLQKATKHKEDKSLIQSSDGYLGSRIGHAVRHISYETTHIAVLYELRYTLTDIVEEAHGVSQEVHRAKDLSCLADQLLQTANNTQL